MSRLMSLSGVKRTWLFAARTSLNMGLISRHAMRLARSLVSLLDKMLRGAHAGH
jgi:hypothetical protein